MSIDQSDLSLDPEAGETPSAQLPPDLSPARAPRPAEPRDEAAGLAREARARIGRNLRLLYAEVLDQPLPERFDTLLAELAARNDRGSS